MWVLAEWEGDDADGMTLAVGIWEGWGGCDFCGLNAYVVGAGGRVRWEVIEEVGDGRSFREVCVVELVGGRGAGVGRGCWWWCV